MSASRRFDLSSGSPDRPLYASGHRGAYGAASLDRSGSFRENSNNQLVSSLPNMTRNNSHGTPADVVNYFQCVRFDPRSMVVDHKLNRPAEYKRLASAAVGVPLEDSLPASSKGKQPFSLSPEDLRRLKSSVRESGSKARERVKTLNDCLSVINKCFPTKKRSRLDALSNDRANSLAIDRSISGMSIGIHANMNAVEVEQQKSEERAKNTIPSKRTRTSTADSRADVRANNSARTSGTVDKDRDMTTLSNTSSIQAVDRTLSIALDGWEFPKMRKKRTRIKADGAATSMTAKQVEGYREPKQGKQPRLSAEARSRLTEPHGIRSGITNGGTGVRRTEPTVQTSSGLRCSSSRTDSENSSILHERREQPSAMNLKNVNKANSREDFTSSSPISVTNLNANVRAPRSSAVGGVPKLSRVVQRSMPSNDWELSNCIRKVPGVLGSNNRKRTPSTRPSSPVTSWVQRPQKISRTARRTHLLPAIPSNDEKPAVDGTADVMENERCLPAYSPQQVKIKRGYLSPASLSESEESGAAEIRVEDKDKRYEDIGGKNGMNVQKISTLPLPSRKIKAVSRDDSGDGCRRQGRTGRGFTSSMPLLPSKMEKLGNVGIAKQIRSSRLGVDKTERTGRPPTRKLSDRKAYTRQKYSPITTGTEFLAGSDVGHTELLSAINAVANTGLGLSSPFWKKMEPVFRFISDVDISYLKDQVNLEPNFSAPVPVDAGSSNRIPNGYGLSELGREDVEKRNFELSPENLASGSNSPDEISLYQRLIAALIPEEENQVLLYCGPEDLRYDEYGPRSGMEKDIETDTYRSRMSQSFDPSGYPTSNGYGKNSYGRSSYKIDHNIASISSTTAIPSYDLLPNGMLPNHLMLDTVCSEHQYHNMSINERLLMEVHSIGIYPDLVSRDEEINGDISSLQEKYREQAPRKKSLLSNLLNSASAAKELLEKEFEERALDKLVEMAYGKCLSCFGPTATGMKNAGSKMAKQTALGFVRRVLELYNEFEMTGKSCFDELFYKDMFFSGASHLIDGRPVTSSTADETGKLYHGTSGCSIEVRTSAPVGVQKSPSSSNHGTPEAFLPANGSCEQNTGKVDSWSNRGKRRELLLDDVGGMMPPDPGVPSVLGGSLVCSAKGKRSERDREGKGNSKGVSSRSKSTKSGRPALASARGESKSKAKHKPKMAHISASVNDPLRLVTEQSKGMPTSTLGSSELTGSDICKDKHDCDVDMLEEPIDLSRLELPGMDDLGDPGDLGGQGEDISSWLNSVDVGLHDHDFMDGLQVPTDDLSNLNFTF